MMCHSRKNYDNRGWDSDQRSPKRTGTAHVIRGDLLRIPGAIPGDCHSINTVAVWTATHML